MKCSEIVAQRARAASVLEHFMGAARVLLLPLRKEAVAKGRGSCWIASLRLWLRAASRTPTAPAGALGYLLLCVYCYFKMKHFNSI